MATLQAYSQNHDRHKINHCAPAISTEINSYCSQLDHTKATLIFIKISKTLDVKIKSAKLFSSNEIF